MEKIVRRIERLALGISIITIVAMMQLTAYDALSRYLLHAPLAWAFQVTSYYLLVSATYFALSATFQNGDHISIDAFRGIIPQRILRVSDAIWCLMSAVIFTMVAYGSARSMVHAYQRQEFLPGHIMWPVWLAILPIVLGSALLILRLLVHAWGLTFGNKNASIHHEEDAI